MTLCSMQSKTTTKDNIPNPFRSKRLLFRAIDSPQDDELFHNLHKHQETYVNSDSSLPKPTSRDRTTSLRQYWQRAMLGVLICVIDEGSDNSGSSGVGGGSSSISSLDNNAAASTETSITPVGGLSLFTLGPSMAYHRKAELAISIAPAYQNKGYGTEVIYWVLDWAFKRANLHRVSLNVLEYNGGAIRLYKRIGFQVEKKERESIWHNGAWYGELGMAMLDYEWDAIRKVKS